MIPTLSPISILLKFQDINSIDDFISMDKQHRILTGFNISSCSISIIDSTDDYLSTIPVFNTSVDFIISNIIWNDHFHLNDDISWRQLIFNKRITSMSSYFNNKPLFICDYGIFMAFTYHSIPTHSIHYIVTYKFHKSLTSYFYASKSARNHVPLLNFVLDHVSSFDDCFRLTLFLSEHLFISDDFISLFSFFDIFPSYFLVITNPSFRFKQKGFASINTHSINICIPPISLFITDLSTIEITLINLFGFTPYVRFLAINTLFHDSYHVIVVFNSHSSSSFDSITSNYFRAFNLISNNSFNIDCVKPY